LVVLGRIPRDQEYLDLPGLLELTEAKAPVRRHDSDDYQQKYG